MFRAQFAKLLLYIEPTAGGSGDPAWPALSCDEVQANSQLGILAGVALLLIAAGVWIALQVRQRSPEKREQRRRTHVNQVGRLGDALVTEVADNLLHYTYTVHGVDYSASQDISALRELLPAEPARLVGVAHLKYSPKNPANSILICEQWSGLRRAAAAYKSAASTSQPA